MPIKYFSTAWADVTKSPGWFAKVLLLGLILLIPIFGPIVVYGYLFGWSRELAWRVNAPLPKRIFENSDGKLYRRGFFALVIAVVFSIIPNVFSCMGSILANQGTTSAALASAPFSVAGIVLGLLVNVFIWAGIMRMSLYNKLSAGFQLSKIWKMLSHGAKGMARILGMYILAMVVVCIIAWIVMLLFVLMFSVPLTLMHSGTSAAVSVMSFGVATGMFMFSLVLVYVALCLIVFVEMLVASAVGRWASQFDVALWRGQDDPMPFEDDVLHAR